MLCVVTLKYRALWNMLRLDQYSIMNLSNLRRSETVISSQQVKISSLIKTTDMSDVYAFSQYAYKHLTGKPNLTETLFFQCYMLW